MTDPADTAVTGEDPCVLGPGFSFKTIAVNSLLLRLSRLEFIPQRFFGTSILAVLQNLHP